MNKLAIVIPFYNISFFEETLVSLSKQTNMQFSVYIGDDASLGDVKSIIESFESQINITYKRFKNNMGGSSLVKHWDRCIAMTMQEEWIMILGDDDYVSTNFVEVFYKSLEKIDTSGNSVVKFATKVVDELSKPIFNNSCQKTIIKSTDAFYDKITNQSRSSLSEHIFKKSAYDKYGFKNYYLAWHADDMAWLEFSDFNDIYCINDATVSIRVSSNSISGMESNITAKNKASYQFFSDLISKYFTHFNRKQKNLIIRIFESKKLLLYGKKIKNYFIISRLYLKHFYLISFFRFTFRFFLKRK